MDYDVLIIGAGHNALVAGAYLAQAGYQVGVFERRAIVGGAVSTQEIVPGYQFDLGGSAHILIRLTPIIDELNLESYGLSYLELDPLFFTPFPDDDAVFIYRDLKQTVDHLETKFPGQGKAYEQFVGEWRDFSLAVRDAFLESPSPFALGKSFIRHRSSSLDWKKALPRILRPYGDVVEEYFTEEKIIAPLTWMAAQSGPPPSEPVTGPFVLWQPLYHEGGIARPKGGSGVLTQALQRHIEDHGGTVHVNAPVEEILIEGHRATGIRLHGEIVTARAVLSGTHIKETMTRLLPMDHRPAQT
ncbi:MAG TPA: NAD(P)/FAD-dependent oxidoreductase, partial [Rhodothermales bacterium]|nr:NAD(P)/FAD-dependent oxidoreductase [Rhodothermales bacterium]